MAVSKRLRYEVMRRDNFACRYCRRTDQPLTVDHVVPIALGGSDEPDNLVAACVDCNAGKSSSNPDQPQAAQVSEDAFRWARAMKEAADLQDDSRYMRQRYCEEFLDTWNGWTFTGTDRTVPLPNDWSDSLGRFQELNLEIDVIQDLVGVAMRKAGSSSGSVFKYFCGCCWSTLRERQTIARALLAKEEADH